MTKTLRWSERLGGIFHAPRLYFAAVPLTVPLIFATIEPSLVSKKVITPELAPLPAVVFNAPAPRTTTPLPEHATYLEVRSGDTLDSIFRSGGLTAAQAFALVDEFGKSIDPRKLRPGDLIRFQYDEADQVTGVSMKVTGWGEISARRDQEVFHVSAAEAPQRVEEIPVTSAIETSLYEAIRRTGESPQLVSSLVDVFQWDVDFFSLQKGDSFSLVVEKRFSGSDHTGYGPITAARFTHEGRTYEAYRFLQPNGRAGYYTASGTPVRKQFLKAPLKFTRITSGFTRKRFHPILKIMRAHHGVDYGAPVGTPVMSTADGVILYAGYDRGEGLHVRIKHNSRIETSYLHLSRFAKGIRRGTRIEQGEVIGFVGTTGLSTGPHLDYRVRDGSTWINPLQLKSITPDPLRGAALGRFRDFVGKSKSQFGNATQLATTPEVKRRALF